MGVGGEGREGWVVESMIFGNYFREKPSGFGGRFRRKAKIHELADDVIRCRLEENIFGSDVTVTDTFAVQVRHGF